MLKLLELSKNYNSFGYIMVCFVEAIFNHV